MPALSVVDMKSMVSNVLTDINMVSESAVNLLLMTCAAESDFGTYRKQIKGPALGIYQMEPATYFWLRDLYQSRIPYIEYKHPDDMIMDDRLATIMARLRYRVVKEPLPSDSNDIYALAEYWKRWYNTYRGKGTVEKCVSKYKKFVLTVKD